MRPAQRTGLILAVCVLAAAGLSRPAWAADPSGLWLSDSGTRVIIPPTPEFLLIFLAPDGKKTISDAAWTSPQRVGVQFMYISGGSVNTGTFDPNDPNRIHLQTSTGTVRVWTRQAAHKAAPANLADPTGVWSSDSGSTFIIPPLTTEFLVIGLTNDGNRFICTGSWVQAQGVKQFQYNILGNVNTCSIDPANPARITLQGANGGVRTWTRTAAHRQEAVAGVPQR